MLTDAQFQSWGWRIPFVFSLVMVAIGLYIRMQILETPMFARAAREEERSADCPSIDAIRGHWKPILLSAFARLSEQAPFYVITSFTLVYLTEEQGYSKTFALAAILSAAALEVIAVPLFGQPVRHPRPQEDLHDRCRDHRRLRVRACSARWGAGSRWSPSSVSSWR